MKLTVSKVSTPYSEVYSELYCKVSKAADRGGKLLGAGCFGTVFQHPTDTKLVIKIGRGRGGSWRISEDADPLLRSIDGYSDWLLSVARSREEGKDCEFFPKILSATVFYNSVKEAGNPGCAYLVVMEKLGSLIPARLTKKQAAGKIKTVLSRIDPRLKQTWELGKMEDCGWRPSTEEGRVLHKALNPVLSRRGCDLHNGNIMIRKEVSGREIPVITDPVV